MHKSNSDIQMKSEKVNLRILEKELNLPAESLVTREIQINDRSKVEIDGLNEDLSIMVEVFSRVGNLKPAHYEKIANDIMKLVMVEKIQGKTYRKILAVCDEAVEKYMLGTSWKAHAIKVFDFEVMNIDVGMVLKNEILHAQMLQKEGMKL